MKQFSFTMKSSVLYLITVSRGSSGSWSARIGWLFNGACQGNWLQMGNETCSLISGFNVPTLEVKVGFVKCALWLFLLGNSRLLNVKCCFLALAQQGKVLCYKSTVGGEGTGRKARVFICFHYAAAAANTDRSFPSKRPLGTGYLHINGRR